MRRMRQQVVWNEAEQALRRLLPAEWIVRDITPDYGLDMEVTIVEGKKVTTKVLALQLKATDSAEGDQKTVYYQMETKYLKYYEYYPLPVLVLYYVKPRDTFYYLFAQRYIRETLAVDCPDWRDQKTVTVKFALDSRLKNADTMAAAAADGYFYVAQLRLGARPDGATYWLDGIPKSDDRELKERTLKALSHVLDNKYPAAIAEFENMLKVCTVSPTERMSLLLNLGNAYYSLSQYDDALRIYRAVLELTGKVAGKNAREGKSEALANTGLILRARGDLDSALKYLHEALEIDREIGYRQGEAADLGNIGNIYSDTGDLDSALKYLHEALEIDREIGYRQGEATDLGNIGNIHSARGDLENALKYQQDALTIHREIGYKQGEANQLGNIGLIYSAKGDSDSALKYHQDALKIHREIGYKQGEAADLGNIGLIYSAKGDSDSALKYHQDALKIHREIGYKQGEAADLGNIGLIFRAKGDSESALKYHRDALKIDREIGYKQGEANQLGNIGNIYSDKGDSDSALKYQQDALRLLDRSGLVHGREVIQNAMNSVTKLAALKDSLVAAFSGALELSSLNPKAKKGGV